MNRGHLSRVGTFSGVGLAVCLSFFVASATKSAQVDPVAGSEDSAVPAPAQTQEQAQAETKEVEVPLEQELARDRQQTAEEDPVTVRQSKVIDDPEAAAAEEPSIVAPYLSVRGRYRSQSGDSIWTDGDSRFGIHGQLRLSSRYLIAGRAEFGLNLLDTQDVLFNPRGRSSKVLDSEPVFLRLLYFGIEGPRALSTFGKSWSTYYKVSSFTDKFQGLGGSASGTYNAGTDGGPTGTGRADRVLQVRSNYKFSPRYKKIKPFHLNFQVQYDEPIPGVPDARYGATYGLSALFEMENDFTFGLAMNYANVRDLGSLKIRAAGIDGDARAFILGTRQFRDRWYVGTTLARLLDHESTDTGIFFDGWGWEVYGQYRFQGSWWGIVGWNALEPDSDQAQAGFYRVRYGVLGVRYSFDLFRRMVYFNARLSDGRTTVGDKAANIYTVGVRWDFP